jgi:heat shock protein HtpX
MISALRKIENRGELEGATSAVMEMCVDNPREGFADLFASHPSIDRRVAALVEYAGGHDPGPIALPRAEETPGDEAQGLPERAEAEAKPFLPERPPIELGRPASRASGAEPGRWTPPRGR